MTKIDHKLDIIFVKTEDIPFSVRTRNRLEWASISRIGDLVTKSRSDLLKIRGFGKKCILEVENFLGQYGLELGMKIPGWNDKSHNEILKNLISKVNAKNKPPRLLSKKKYAELLINTLELPLSIRARNCLKNNRIKYIGDLVAQTPTDLLKIRGFGRNTLEEIRSELRKRRLNLNMQVSNWPPENIKNSVIAHRLEINEARKKWESLSHSKANNLEEELYNLVSFVKVKRDRDIILKFYGWSGSSPRTLESVGQEYGITRERVRQIINKFANPLSLKLKNRGLINLPILRETIDLIGYELPCTADLLESKIQRKGLSNNIFPIESIAQASETTNIKNEFAVKNVRGHRFVVPKKIKKLPRYIISYARKAITTLGVVTASDVAATVTEKTGYPVTEEFVNVVLRSYNEFILLDEIHNWYWCNKCPRNRLLNILKKILSVTDSIHVSELRSGISRFHRMQGIAPPRRVLLMLCQELSWCKVKGSMIEASPPLNYEEILEANEWLMASILQEEGYVLNRYRFRELCKKYGMNDNTFDLYLSFSPIITRYDIGIYGLRGANVLPGQINSQRPEKRLNRVLKDFGYTKDGRIWIAFKLSQGLINSGVFSIPAAIKQFLQGSYQLVTGDGTHMGNITIKNNQGWNIRPFLVRRGGEVDDYLYFTLDASDYKAEVNLGDDELLVQLSGESF